MSDIFREVEEDVRRERLQKLWQGYGSYMIAALVLVFLGLGGWQLWERHETQQRAKASDALIAAQRITNPQTAAGAFVDLARTAPKGYDVVARLSQAGAMLASGQRSGAIDLYKEIANQDNGPVGAVARLRAAWALAETAPRVELSALLKPLDQPGSVWRQNAREVLAYADYRAMDAKSALAKYSALAADPASQDGLRTRASAMAAFLKNGGAVNYGSVPPEAVPTLPQQGAQQGGKAGHDVPATPAAK